MYLSLNWLKDFLDIPKNISSEELGLKLTMHTVEIDSVIEQKNKFDGIVVGKILEIKEHPNSDRLKLVRVDIRSEVLDVVCGASNIEEGQTVPVATIGTILPGGAEIKKAEVRGEISCGMICAEDELGLGNDHSGIMILQSGKVGQSFGDYLGYDDIIFEVDNKSITNRPDLWGHVGMAREIAAFLNTKFKVWDKSEIKSKEKDIQNKIKIKVEDASLCPRYMALSIGGIKVAPSPDWMQKRLIAVGMKPINNIVDITNYVMLELGQPMHAFDKRTVFGEEKEAEIIVRKAKKGENFITLDGQKRELDNGVILIANKKLPLAIAGVMGGEDSGINEETDSIVLESANFNSTSIRIASQKLGLRTESSVRFEKFLDPNLCEEAMLLAAGLIKKIIPNARIESEIADEKNFKLNQDPIELDLNLVKKIIGEDVEEKRIIKTLESLGFEVENKDNILNIIVPSWRATKDISIKEDLIEEITRIYGYDNLVPVMPRVEMKAPLSNNEREVERKIKNLLSLGACLTEVYNYSFVGEDQLEKLGVDFSSHIRLANPIASHQSLLRQTMAVNLFGNIKINQARYEEFSFFEIGFVYLPIDGELKKRDHDNENLPYQEKRLGVVSAGENARETFDKAKGIVMLLGESFNLNLEFNITENIPGWADGRQSAQVNSGQMVIGFVYSLSSAIAKKNGIKKSAAVVEISLTEFNKAIRAAGEKKFQAFLKFPSSGRDLSFVINEKVLYNDIRREILNFHEYIKQAELFDIYEGDKVGKSLKSMAFHIVYQTNKTMTAEEVDEIQGRLIKKLEEKFGAQIRDF
ncbi:MAG: phenylalanine--tRNA ligase subunit beta [bacterium]